MDDGTAAGSPRAASGGTSAETPPGRLLARPDGSADVDPSASRSPKEAVAPQPLRFGVYVRRVRPVLEVLLVAVVALPALALSVPIALVNLVLFRDPRRILYAQPRVGRDGRVFRIFKFRTMREVHRPDFESWRHGHEDARVTTFGRLLRNTHLDELPQVLNVVIGDMSIVGPRPEMVEIDEWARGRVPGFARRYALKPGITGFAQITEGYAGMDADAYARKLAADEEYLRDVSLGLDSWILWRTALWMLRGRGWRWRDGARG